MKKLTATEKGYVLGQIAVAVNIIDNIRSGNSIYEEGSIGLSKIDNIIKGLNSIADDIKENQ